MVILPLFLHPVKKCSAPWFSGRVKQFSPGSLLSKFRCWVRVWGVPIDNSGLSFIQILTWDSLIWDEDRKREKASQFTYFGICWLCLGELSP